MLLYPKKTQFVGDFMNYELKDLKEAVERFSKAIEQHSKEEVEMYAKRIGNIAGQLKAEFFAEHVDGNTIEIKPSSSDHHFKRINTIAFLYKPMPFENVYETDEIEHYVKERTEELMESGAIDPHNAFWQDHNIVYGNVYGSLPVELMDNRAFERLKRCGWRETEVEVLEMKGAPDDFQARQIAKNHYRHYILIRESATGSLMLLRYNF